MDFPENCQQMRHSQRVLPQSVPAESTCITESEGQKTERLSTLYWHEEMYTRIGCYKL